MSLKVGLHERLVPQFVAGTVSRGCLQDRFLKVTRDFATQDNIGNVDMSMCKYLYLHVIALHGILNTKSGTLPVNMRFARVYFWSTAGSCPLKTVRDPSPSTMVLQKTSSISPPTIINSAISCKNKYG